MSTMLNRDTIKQKRERPKNDKGEELVKGKECATCKNMYGCKGKPRSVENCLNYAERTVGGY